MQVRPKSPLSSHTIPANHRPCLTIRVQSEQCSSKAVCYLRHVYIAPAFNYLQLLPGAGRLELRVVAAWEDVTGMTDCQLRGHHSSRQLTPTKCDLETAAQEGRILHNTQVEDNGNDAYDMLPLVKLSLWLIMTLMASPCVACRAF